MAANTKRIFYVKYLPGAVYPTVLAKRPDVQRDKLENETPDDIAAPILAQAHVYQIGASRQIIAPRLQVHAELLAREGHFYRLARLQSVVSGTAEPA